MVNSLMNWNAYSWDKEGPSKDASDQTALEWVVDASTHPRPVRANYVLFSLSFQPQIQSWVNHSNGVLSCSDVIIIFWWIDDWRLPYIPILITISLLPHGQSPHCVSLAFLSLDISLRNYILSINTNGRVLEMTFILTFFTQDCF